MSEKPVRVFQEQPRSKRKLGRPEGHRPTKDNLVEVAEDEFAKHGFAGASLRRIGERAGVTQAVIHYHFGSKEGLFQEIFLRRGRQISDERTTQLLRLQREKRSLTVEAIVHAFLLPAIRMKRDPAGAAFIRMQARLHTEPQEIGYVLRRQVFDASTQLYVGALAKALPGLDRGAIYFRMIFSVGAYLYSISDAHRLEELSGGRCDARDYDALLDHLVAYISAGLRSKAPAAARARGSAPRSRGSASRSR